MLALPALVQCLTHFLLRLKAPSWCIVRGKSPLLWFIILFSHLSLQPKCEVSNEYSVAHFPSLFSSWLFLSFRILIFQENIDQKGGSGMFMKTGKCEKFRFKFSLLIFQASCGLTLGCCFLSYTLYLSLVFILNTMVSRRRALAQNARCHL